MAYSSRSLRLRKSSFAGSVGACALMFLLATSRVHAEIVSTFDTGLDGWSGVASQGPASQYSRGSSGGNPGGYFDFIDQAPTTGTIAAPAEFLGSWSALNGSGSLMWDHIIFSTGGDPTSFGPFEAEISGPGGSAQFTTTVNDAVVGQWITTTAPINQADWTVLSGSWSALLTDVTSLQIVIELVTNVHTPSPSDPGDHDGIDNVILGTQSVPEPSSLMLAAIGVACVIVAPGRARWRTAESKIPATKRRWLRSRG
jgi:PEP-CTERM motif